MNTKVECEKIEQIQVLWAFVQLFYLNNPSQKPFWSSSSLEGYDFSRWLPSPIFLYHMVTSA